MITKTPAIVLGLLCFASCEKTATTPPYNDLPVIEGYLYANNNVEVRISRQVASSANVVYSDDHIDSLDISLSDEDSTFYLEASGNGTYKNSRVIIRGGVTYTIRFEYNGKIVSAVTTIPSTPENYTQSQTAISIQKIDSNTTFTPGSFQINDPVELSWSNPDNSYYMLYAKNTETNLELIRDTTQTRFRTASFRNEPSKMSSSEIRDQQFQYFGKYMLILFHLNPDYAALYNDNSNSSQNLSNPTSNITNGLGIFTGISADTLYLQVNKK